MLSSTLLATMASIASASSVVDSAMRPMYNTLAQHCMSKFKTISAADGPPYWVGIGGGPGSGKSTLAEAVAKLVNDDAGEEICVVLPMDGFHYSREKLRELDPPSAAEYLPRRGAPWTFDAEGCYECFSAAKSQGEAVLPTYSRELSDPVPGGVQLEQKHKIVLCEGNYLLMKHDPRWAPLDDLWDERWFIRCADADAQRTRLIYRHLETWNDEKSERWGKGEVGAAARADANDVLNMGLIAPCEEVADRVIVSE